jgi:hypothetical protein
MTGNGRGGSDRRKNRVKYKLQPQGMQRLFSVSGKFVGEVFLWKHPGESYRAG